MKKQTWLVCLFPVILLAGCSFSEDSTVAVIPTERVTQLAGLTLQMLQNYSYLAPQYNRSAPLKDGTFTTNSSAETFTASLQPEVAFGDLNGDGAEDAAVLLAENGGGTGVFVSLTAVLNENGAPMQVATAFIDDRPIIGALEISNGKIILDVTIHGPNDPMVSPTMKVSETYQMPGTGITSLVLTRFISYTPNGSKRTITISNPKNGDPVSASIQVQGSMPIGPFENTLAYRLYDESGNKLAEGPFMVNSDGTGGTSTFDAPVDISALPKGIVIRLELVDVNMADGSTLALDSVELATQ